MTYRKKVRTLPIPNIPAAQALPSGWSSVGRTSTRRALSAAWTALIEKSMKKMENTARATVNA